jgi:4-amino-4-deoxy-L-arabinose transferase-like glycosyltransferase
VAIAVIVAAGAALRIAWSVYAARPLAYVFGGDPNAYVFYARSLVEGDGYPSLVYDGPGAFHPPGWPLLLAAWYWATDLLRVPGGDFRLASVLAVGLSTASIVLVFLLARRLVGTRSARWAALVYALWPNVVFYVGAPALETSFVFFCLLGIWLLVRHPWPEQPLTTGRAVAAGLPLGYSVLIRPFSVVVLPALGVALWLSGHGRRRALREIALLGAVLVAAAVPWTVRNAVQVRAFVPVSTNMGETFCLGHHPGASGGFVAIPPYCTRPHEHVVGPADEAARNRIGLRRGLRYAVRHPAREVRLLATKVHLTLGDDHDGLDAVESNGADPFIGRGVRSVLRRGADFYYYAVVVLAVLGLPGLVRGRDAARLVVLGTAVGLLLVPFGLYGLARFKVPVTPFLAISAGVTLARVSRRARQPPGIPGESA